MAISLINSLTLRAIMPTLVVERAEFFAPYLDAATTEFKINTPVRAAMFLAQAAHESGELRRLVENLNYSAEGLRRTWPTRFTDDATAAKFSRRPAAIAEKVYGSRLGNTEVGDGFKYRGRGIFQLTGKANYRLAGEALGLPLVEVPELLEHPDGACRSAGWFWQKHGLNELADKGDFVGTTKAINGGLIGLQERQKYHARAKQALGVKET